MQFDVIVGNPPYQAPGGTQTGRTIWDKFMKMNMELVKEGGYLNMVHPGRWRQCEDKLKHLYHENQLLYVKIFSVKDGQKTFGACTPYDCYQFHKLPPYQPTKIQFMDRTTGEYDVTQWPFIPNFMVDFWIRAFEDEGPKLQVVMTHTHSPDKKHVVMEPHPAYPFEFIQKLSGKETEYGYSMKPHQFQGEERIVFRDQGKPWAQLYDGGCGVHTYSIISTDQKVLDWMNGPGYREVAASITFGHRQVPPKPLCFIPLSFITDK